MSNLFGNMFRFMSWGESHGPAIGVVIDGCPAGVLLDETDLIEALQYRRPGNSLYVSARKEPDIPKILSGVFEGKTTGAPISVIIYNQDADSNAYHSLKNVLRPGHADYTYLQKYGIYDYRGGGRASARETASRVMAGAVAKKILDKFEIKTLAYLKKIGEKNFVLDASNKIDALKIARDKSPIFCPDESLSREFCNVLQEVKEKGDSIGGVVEAIAVGVPAGLGEPIYQKLEAMLASAMLSIPASKGFEIGLGFESATYLGSEHNDTYRLENACIVAATNLTGGILGGITTGNPIVIRIPFKPASSIKQKQQTTNLQGEEIEYDLPLEARHDPCVAIRAVPVVQAMMQLVLADALLMDQLSCVNDLKL